jgi:preprotein translocase subunit SecG
MRVLVALNLVTGLCLIIFGTVLQKPIRSFPPVAFILLGVLSWVSAIVGLVAGHKVPCCLSIFLTMHGLNTLCQAILVVLLHVDREGLVKIIGPPEADGMYGEKKVNDTMKAASWIMLIFLLLEVLVFMLAVALRYWLDPDPDNIYTNFEQQNQEERTLSMSALRTDVEVGGAQYNAGNNSVYNKLRAKMANKYGQFSHGVSWKPKKWFGW